MSRDRSYEVLTIEVVKGRLMISIGVATLMDDLAHSDDWNDETLTIVDPYVFAEEIARAIFHDEQLPGLTPIRLAFEGAARTVLEKGTDAVWNSEKDGSDD